MRFFLEHGEAEHLLIACGELLDQRFEGFNVEEFIYGGSVGGFGNLVEHCSDILEVQELQSEVFHDGCQPVVGVVVVAESAQAREGYDEAVVEDILGVHGVADVAAYQGEHLGREARVEEAESFTVALQALLHEAAVVDMQVAVHILTYIPFHNVKIRIYPKYCMASPKKFYIASRGVFNFHAEGDVVGWNRSSRGGLAEFFCRYLLDIYIGAPKLTFMFLTASKSHEFYLFIYGFICLYDVVFINSQKINLYALCLIDFIIELVAVQKFPMKILSVRLMRISNVIHLNLHLR